MSDDMRKAEPQSGDETDAWLREALRHAPDAAAAPPRALSDAILRESRHVVEAPVLAASGAAVAGTRIVRPRSQPTFAQRLLAFWSSLGSGPAVPAMAGLLVAVFVGMLWWQQPLDEALPKAPSPSRSPSPNAEADRAAAPATATTAATPMAAPAAVPAPPPTDGKAVPPPNASATLAPDELRSRSRGESRFAAAPPPAPRLAEKEDFRRATGNAEPAPAPSPTEPLTLRKGALGSGEQRRQSELAGKDAPAAAAARAFDSRSDVAAMRDERRAVDAEAAKPGAPNELAQAFPQGAGRTVDRFDSKSAQAPANDVLAKARSPELQRARGETTAPPPSGSHEKIAAAPSSELVRRELESADKAEAAKSRPAPSPAVVATPAPAAPRPASPPAVAGALGNVAPTSVAAAPLVANETAATQSAMKRLAPAALRAASDGPPIGRWLERPLELGAQPGASRSDGARDIVLVDWLTRLDAATRGRWTAEPDADFAAQRRDAPALMLYAGQQRLATLRFSGDSVLLESDGSAPRRWRASLAPEVAAALRASLPVRSR